MTREEHIQWCKERAILEYDYYINKEPLRAINQGITSMMSDLGKHPETQGLQQLCLFQLLGNPGMRRDEFVNFINGFR